MLWSTCSSVQPVLSKKKALSYARTEFPVFQFVPVGSDTGHHGKEPGSMIFIPSPSRI